MGAQSPGSARALGYVGTPEGAGRARAVAQAVSDFVRAGDLDGVRALDLGAGSGVLAAELAARGAEVLAVEGREANVADIEAVRDALDLGGRLEARLADVRTLDWPALGRFDVILCSGLLYHLELDDVVALTERIRGACSRLALFDTEVAWGPVARAASAGRPYAGLRYREFAAETGAAEKQASVRASLDNEQSFWLTRPSLHALLHDAGFSSSWELGTPGQLRRHQRATVAALVGERVSALAVEPAVELPSARPWEPPAGRVLRARVALARLRRG